VRGLPDGAALNSLAGGLALWASVSEGRATRAESSRDLLLLSTAAALGAASFIFLAPLLQQFGHAGPELTLVTGAFLVGYLRRFGLTGTGIGSQIYIGQLLAYGARLSSVDLPMVVVAGLLAALASVVPRVLSGPAEHPPPVPAAPLVLWAAAALAMVIYAMALAERYDVACGAFAFTLIVTLAISGDHSIPGLHCRRK
jgi:hypothetical protein